MFFTKIKANKPHFSGLIRFYLDKRFIGNFITFLELGSL